VKVIFSRKGVDSAAGRLASALVDGRPYSLPIPAGRTPSPTRYCDLGEPYRRLARELSGDRLARQAYCHLDPDLDPAVLAVRPAGWRGALGQWGGALGHLQRHGVGEGDLFLFWGLYRDVELAKGKWRYCGPRKHCLFGWLAVGEVLVAGEDGSHLFQRHPWLADYPHARPGWNANKAIFVAAPQLEIGGRIFPGYGLLRRAIVLTAPEASGPSRWAVPAWLDPTRGGTGMSCNPPSRWNDGQVTTAPRGQEFVADIGDRGDALDWIAEGLAGNCA